MKWVANIEPPHAPISMARRVRRGFSRIGLILAVLTLCAGAVLSAALAIEAADGKINRHAALTCLKTSWSQGKAYPDKYNPGTVDYAASGCKYAYVTWDELRTHDPKLLPSWTFTMILTLLQGIGITAIATGLAFAGPWIIGWILSGFLGE